MSYEQLAERIDELTPQVDDIRRKLLAVDHGGDDDVRLTQQEYAVDLSVTERMLDDVARSLRRLANGDY